MFGKRLRDLREDKDLKQKDLASIIGVSDRTIGMYEQERREPDFETLKKIADYFNVSTDYLLGRTDIKNVKVVNDTVDGHKIEIGVDKDAYPDGLTHEQVIEILEGLKKAGVKLNPNQEK